MKYVVKRTPDARNQLAAIWVESVSRNAVAEAANRLDAALAVDAARVGESRDGLTRIAFEKPLVIQFVVLADDRLAVVADVRTY